MGQVAAVVTRSGCSTRSWLLRDRLDPAAHVHLAGPAAIDDAGRVGRDAFRHVGVGRDFRNERHHLAVLRAADANALLEAGIDLAAVITRLVIGRIHVVVSIDVEAARAPELLPFLEELAVLIENLDAIVDAISHEQPAGRIHGQLMRSVELARPAAALAPGLDVGAILGELEDAIVGARAVSLRNEDVAVGRNVDVSRLIEGVGGARIAGDARLAQRHQYLAVLAELDDGLAFAAFRDRVRDPNVAVTIDVEAVRIVHHAAAEFGLHVAVGIELHDRIERRATAVLRGTAVERPQALTVGIDLDADGRAPGPPRRQLRPILLQLIRIGIGVGIIGLGEYPLSGQSGERESACTQQQRSIACGLHVVSSLMASIVTSCCERSQPKPPIHSVAFGATFAIWRSPGSPMQGYISFAIRRRGFRNLFSRASGVGTGEYPSREPLEIAANGAIAGTRIAGVHGAR